ncbi:hypothetical protein EAN04_24695 [Salmonella enterica]|nr:hypothetical protein [Salmonella enterica]
MTLNKHNKPEKQTPSAADVAKVAAMADQQYAGTEAGVKTAKAAPAATSAPSDIPVLGGSSNTKTDVRRSICLEADLDAAMRYIADYNARNRLGGHNISTLMRNVMFDYCKNWLEDHAKEQAK